MKLNRIFSLIGLALSVVLFTVVVPAIFYYCYLWGHRILEGVMMGGDSGYHLAWIQTLNRFYPKIPMWFPFAGSGSSIVLGYWVFPYYLAIIGSHLSNLSTVQWVRLLEFLTTPIVCAEIYLYLWIRLKNVVAALLGALLYPLSSIAWGWVSQAGFFSMQVSTVVFLPAFMFFDLYLETELTEPEKASRKRTFLFGFMAFMFLGFLIHGSFMPILYFGLPFYAVLRSQLLPRKKEKRIISFLRSVKAITIALVFGVLAGAYFFLPQRRYFSLQPFVSYYSPQDTPILPWRAFIGLERLTLTIGSLYVPLFISIMITFWAAVGLILGLVKRHFLAALGLISIFYIWWLSSASMLAGKFPFLQVFILPTATRAASIVGIYVTILAVYGLWSAADLPGLLLRWIGQQFREKGRFFKIMDISLAQFSYLISTVLVLGLTAYSIYYFKPKQTYQKWGAENVGAMGPYRGYGTYGIEGYAPLCMVPGWENEVGEGMTCKDYLPQWAIDNRRPDFWPADFTQAVDSLGLTNLDRVSISPFLGSLVFSFAGHSQASLASAPSGQSVINLGWLGIQDKIMYLKGSETSQEAVEISKWFGTKFSFQPEEHKDIYPKDLWLDRFTSNQVVVKELINSPGMFNISNKPAMLVIGSHKDDAFTLLFQIGVNGGFSYDQAMLIEGSDKIDDYSLEELKKFDVLVLQGYSYRSQSKAWQLLKDYVKSGGSLYLETGWQYVSKDWGKGPDKQGQFLPAQIPEPSPVKQTLWGNIGTDWSQVEMGSDLGEGINLANFGLPAWGSDAWGMALADRANLRSWAEPILSKNGKIIIAKGKYGQGKVIWSGMNLFSHAYDKDISEEYLFINKIFNYLLPTRSTIQGKVSVNWDNPDRIEITLTETPENPSFLYLADSYTPDWKAYQLKSGQKERLKIYQAGPGFKAVRLTNLLDGEKIVFEYNMTKIWLFYGLITLLGFAFLFIFIVDSALFNGKLERKIKSPFISLFSGGKGKNAPKGKISQALHWDDDES